MLLSFQPKSCPGLYFKLAMDIKNSNSKWVFSGRSFNTADTVKSPSFLSLTILPMASSSPNKLLAAFSVSTIACTSFKAVAASPIMSGKLNTCRKPVSTMFPDFVSFLSPAEKRIPLLLTTLTARSTSGRSFSNTAASGADTPSSQLSLPSTG